MERLNGVRKISVSVRAINMIPLIAGSPSNVATFGWIVVSLLTPLLASPALALEMMSGEYVTLSCVT
jgi:hypothetical protein